MCRKLFWIYSFISLSLAGVAAASQDKAKPDFSGVWKINLRESRLQIPAPDAGIFSIEHKEPNFRLSRTFVRSGQEDTWTIDLTTDGKEVVQEDEGETFRGKLTWQGADLFLDSTVSVGGRTAANKVTYHLSADGRSLTATEVFRGPRLKYDNVWIFDKQ